MMIALAGYKYEKKEARVADNEDDKLVRFLAENNIGIQPVVWNDPAVSWNSYEWVVIKSTWDYHDHLPGFIHWLKSLRKMGVAVLNPVDILLWNCDKHYLADVQASGLPVIPSIFVEKESRAELGLYFRQFNTEKIIVKPCVSGGSKHTYAINASGAANFEATINELLASESLLIQPFIPEIETQGEISFIFLGGTYSHCIVKRPRKGDFRVQYYYGGSVEKHQPPPQLIDNATAYVNQFAKQCLYARVDGILVNGTFLLMELELIEPFLFLSTDNEAYRNYYNALKAFIP